MNYVCILVILVILGLFVILVKLRIGSKNDKCTLCALKPYYKPGMKFDHIVCGYPSNVYTLGVSVSNEKLLSGKGWAFLISSNYYVYNDYFIRVKNVKSITEEEFEKLAVSDAGYFQRAKG